MIILIISYTNRRYKGHAMLRTLFAFAISLIIGILIGMERERSHPKGSSAMGVRTFVLFALLGSIAAVLNNFILSLAISFFIVLAILLGYYLSVIKQEKIHDVGITTEIAAAIVYCLGFMTPSNPTLACVLGSVVLLTLLERKRLHQFARKRLRAHEIESAIILFIFIVGVLPLLPNQTIDPWHIFNPRQFGFLLAMIAGIQFGGYMSIRLFGDKIGMVFMGLFGGFVSSTVVFASLPAMLTEHPKLTRSIIAIAILSIVAMLIEISLILLVVSTTLLSYLIWPMVAMLLLAIIIAFSLLFTEKIAQHEFSKLSNPLHILSVFKLALLIGGMIALVSLAKFYLGTKGILFVSFLGGLFEIHSVTLATSLLYLANQLQLTNAEEILAVGIFASFVSKYFLLWTLCPRRFAMLTTVYMSLVLAVGMVTFFVVQGYVFQ